MPFDWSPFYDGHPKCMSVPDRPVASPNYPTFTAKELPTRVHKKPPITGSGDRSLHHPDGQIPFKEIDTVYLLISSGKQ